MVNMMDTSLWPEGDREHVGDELRGGGCGWALGGHYIARGQEKKGGEDG